MNKKYRWLVKATNYEAIQQLQKDFLFTEEFCKILASRGLIHKEEVHSFLNPSWDNIHHYNKFNQMEQAVARIATAIQNKEKIVIYGDYDADGITATALLYQCFCLFDANIYYYIPERNEGYGVNKTAIKKIHQKGITLIITVDCGISNYVEVEYAKTLGIDMIITDHHELGEIIPKAVAVINPKDKNSGYPFKGIAGVGVAFKLAWAICQRFSPNTKYVRPHLKDFLMNALGLVALGSVADVAPLHDENRILIKYGLKVLEQSKNIGIKALKDISRLSNTSELSTEDIGFRIGPRINAVGRISSAKQCVELLTTNNITKAQELAKSLEYTNQKRRSIQTKIQQQAQEIIQKKELYKKKVLVVGYDNWSVGVIGIVAGRLLNEYYRPVFVISFEDNIGKGSARSIKGFHLFHALQQSEQYLHSYGGHELAAGFQIEKNKLEDFDKYLNKLADQLLKPEDFQPSLEIDTIIPLYAITWNLIHQIEKMKPFGEGNPEPILLTDNVEIIKNPPPQRYGNKGEHLSFRVRQENSVFPCIYFQNGDLCDYTKKARTCSIVYSLKKNEWRDQLSIQLDIKDIQFHL